MKYRYLLFMAVVLFSCHEAETFETVLKKWSGKTIKFPENNPVYMYARDTAKYVIAGDKPYKILLYSDSTGCTNCKLRLAVWRDYIDAIGDKVDFLFWFNPKDEEELSTSFKINRFKYPVYMDNDDKLNKLNRFPTNPMYQCFLLDKDNKVILAGNPVYSTNLWELYKNIVLGKVKIKL